MYVRMWIYDSVKHSLLSLTLTLLYCLQCVVAGNCTCMSFMYIYRLDAESREIGDLESRGP